MTVYSTAIATGFQAADGAQTQWGWSGLAIPSAEYVVLDLRAADGTITTLTTGFSVVLLGTDSGYATLTPARPSGTAVRVRRKIIPQQRAQIGNQGAFYPLIHEQALDLLTMMVQEIQANTNAVVAPLGDTPLNLTLPYAPDRANRALVFGADGSVGVSVDNYTDQQAIVAAALAAVLQSEADSAAILVQIEQMLADAQGNFTPGDNTVSTAKLVALAVTTAKLAAKAVTLAKLQDIASGTVLGRVTAGTGAIELLDGPTLRTILGGWYEPNGFRITGATGTAWMWELPADAKEWRLTFRGPRPASGNATLTIRCGSAGSAADSGASDYFNQNYLMSNASFSAGAASQSAPTVFYFPADGAARRVVAEGSLGSANDLWSLAATVQGASLGTVIVGHQFSERLAAGRKPRLFLTSDVALVAGDFLVEARN